MFGTLARAFLFLSQLLIMDEKHHTIGLVELLDEVNRDLDEFRRKHSSDFSVKTISLWWDMERERLVTRHNPHSVIKKVRRLQAFRNLVIWFFAGLVVMLAMDTAIRLFLV